MRIDGKAFWLIQALKVVILVKTNRHTHARVQSAWGKHGCMSELHASARSQGRQGPRQTALVMSGM